MICSGMGPEVFSRPVQWKVRNECAPYEQNNSVPRPVDHLAFGNSRHQGAELLTGLFDRMSVVQPPRRFEERLSNRIFRLETLHELAGPNVFEHRFSAVHPLGIGQEVRT